MMYGPETVTVEAFIRHLKRMTPNPRTSPMDSELKSAIERLRRLRDEVRGIIVDEMTGDMRLLVSDADDAAKRIVALLHASATPRSAVESGFAAADNNQETWRPISDAPTTGVRIVATNPLWPEDRRVRVVWWVEHGPSQDEGQYWQDDDDSEPDPTLWQPLDTFATPVPRLTKALEEAQTQAEAIAAWNRRTSSPQEPGEQTAVRAPMPVALPMPEYRYQQEDLTGGSAISSAPPSPGLSVQIEELKAEVERLWSDLEAENCRACVAEANVEALVDALTNSTVALEFISGRRGGEEARRFKAQAAANRAALAAVHQAIQEGKT